MWNVDAAPAPGQTKTRDYLIAAGAVVVAALVVYLISPSFLSTSTPAPVSVSMFFCAILLGAWRGGMPAALAFLMSLLCVYGFFKQPGGYHLMHREEVRLAYFALVGGGIAWLGAAKSAALRAAWSANDDLARAVQTLRHINQQLERESAERERNYEKLRFSEALLTEGQRISHIGSWLLNIETNKLLWSDEHYRIFGYQPGVGEASFEMAAQRMSTLDRQRVGRIVGDAMRARTRFECEFRIWLPGGEVRHIQASGYPARNAHAGHHEYVGISADITEQRKAEERLSRSERQFRTLAENSPDCVIRYDRHCYRIYVNPAYERKRGVTASDTLHRPLRFNWCWDIPVEQYEMRLRRIIETGEPDQMVGILHLPDGRQIHCSIHAVAERDAGGRVVSVLAIIRDVTSLKQAELRLKESEYLLRQLANRSEIVREEERKHLARELHDDLAQYLLTLRMNISVLNFEFGQRQPALAPKTAAMIEVVDSSITVVRNIITSLRPVALDMGIVSALEWLVQEFIAQTGVVCRLDSVVKSMRINEAFAVAFFRIAQEALRNVARHAGASRVDISFGRRDYGYVLEVTDDGVGFETQVKKPASFGLLGMQERALMLGGHVDIVTEPGAGTSIQVYIPTHTIAQKA